jgi:hypothetical protein
MVTVPECTSKPRSLPSALTAVDAPVPTMLTSPWMSRSPVWLPSSPLPVRESWKVPKGTLMMSAPAPVPQASTLLLVLAAWMDSRKEQSPSVLSSSAVVLTVMVAALAGAAIARAPRGSINSTEARTMSRTISPLVSQRDVRVTRRQPIRFGRTGIGSRLIAHPEASGLKGR